MSFKQIATEKVFSTLSKSWDVVSNFGKGMGDTITIAASAFSGAGINNGMVLIETENIDTPHRTTFISKPKSYAIGATFAAAAMVMHTSPAYSDKSDQFLPAAAQQSAPAIIPSE